MKKMKKAIVFLIVAAMLMSFAVPAYAFDRNPDYSLGDIDGNGKISAADARKILRHAAQVAPLADDQMWSADINADEKVTASDARIALRISATLDSIDNYIKDPEPEDTIDLAEYIYVNYETMAEELGVEFSAVEEVEGLYTSLYTSDICDVQIDMATGEVVFVNLYLENDYSVGGISVGDSADAVFNKFEENGILYDVFADEEDALMGAKALDYESGMYVDIVFDSVSEVVVEVSCYITVNDLIDVLGGDIVEAGYLFPGLMYDEDADFGDCDSYSNGYVQLIVNSDGVVVEAFVLDYCAVSALGVMYGDSAEYVEEVFEWYEIELVDEHVGYCSDAEAYITFLFDPEYDAICYLTISFEYMPDEGGDDYADAYDLANYIFEPVENLDADLWTNGDDYWNTDGVELTIHAPEGRMRSFVLNDICEYNILGLTVGSTADDFLQTCEFYSMYATDETYASSAGFVLTASYDEDGCINYLTYGYYEDIIDLALFYYGDFAYAEAKLDEVFEYYEDEDFSWYASDDISMFVDDDAIVYGIELTDSTDYSILGITIGMDAEYAMQTLENNYEFICVYDDADNIRCMDYYSGDYLTAVVDENGEISSVVLATTVLDIGSIIGTTVEALFSYFPDMAYYEEYGCYFNGFVSAYVDENEYVYEICIEEESWIAAYSVFCGYTSEEALTALTAYGWEMEDEHHGLHTGYGEEISIGYDDEGLVASITLSIYAI